MFRGILFLVDQATGRGKQQETVVPLIAAQHCWTSQQWHPAPERLLEFTIGIA